ncbi:MAG TPA: HemK2/MTQ2 family protein methyltransferase [Aestuariivirgaceae bacterium]|nr:HemK2/MTQ2 family protein methyltransferase [Aestuariivirgaceae bacterium]
MESIAGVGRGNSPQNWSRRALRSFIHFCSYHLILKRNKTRWTQVSGFRLVVRPTVFHPRYFVTSNFFARFIGRLDLTGKRVADVGTGTGILALAAARAGAENVVAIDINPNAVAAATENARANGLHDRVSAICSDLLSEIAPGPRFDVILSNPPFFPDEPRDIADRAWNAGPDYRDIAAFFDQARERLTPNGSMYLLLSSDCDLNKIGALIEDAGFNVRLVEQRSIFFESFDIYELSTRMAHDDPSEA